jgi:hypothetical protein
MTVGELLDRMDSQELAEWGKVFELRAWEAKSGQNANALYTPSTTTMGGGQEFNAER